MNFGNTDILTLIPQRPPFVLVDRLVEATPDEALSVCSVSGQHPLVSCGCLSAAGLMENMAQTAAAHIGAVSEGEVRIGFIGAVRNMQIYYRPQAGEQITTHIRVVQRVFDISLVEAEVRCGKQVCARCELKIALQ